LYFYPKDDTPGRTIEGKIFATAPTSADAPFADRRIARP
jgi:peroxiredoxin